MPTSAGIIGRIKKLVFGRSFFICHLKILFKLISRILPSAGRHLQCRPMFAKITKVKKSKILQTKGRVCKTRPALGLT